MWLQSATLPKKLKAKMYILEIDTHQDADVVIFSIKKHSGMGDLLSARYYKMVYRKQAVGA